VWILKEKALIQGIGQNSMKMSAADAGLECIFTKDLPDVFQLDWFHSTQK